MKVSRLSLGFAVALAVALLSLPSAAMAADGSISGTVTGAGLGPLQGARACAYPDSSSFSSLCTTTNPSGEYAFPDNLAEGGYRVDFEGSGEFIGQWYDGVESEREATDVSVAGGATTPDINAELTKGAAVEGEVSDATSGAPVGQVRVCTSLAEGDPLGSVCATSEANGHYRIVGIPAGAYKLRFEPTSIASDYLPSYWPEAQIFAGGSTLDLTDGATEAGVDVALRTGGSISGKVVNEKGEPVSGLSVCTYPVLGNTNLSYCFENEGATTTDGTYTIHGLPSGEYKVHFFGGTGNYLSHFYPDVPTRAGAAVITIAAPEAVTGIDTTLQSGGVISGTLRESGSHDPLAYVSVCAKPVGGTNRYCGQTKEDGTYSIGSLESREYLVEFGSANVGSDGIHLRRFYGGSEDEAGATPIAVVAGQEETGIDGEIEKGGTIAGEVTDAITAEPAFGIEACAYSGGTVVSRCDTTGNDGQYKITGLPSGSYAVRFDPAGGDSEQNFRVGNKHYVDQFYAGGLSEDEATLVESGPGIEETGIDAAMHEGGGISGTVDGPLGEALSEASVCIVESAEDLGSHCTESGPHGEYELAGLSPGSYVVHVWAPGQQQHELAPEYSGSVLSFDEATAIQVNGTSVTPNVDVQLVPGGTMAGTVVDSFDGSPIAGAEVCAELVSGPGGNCAESGGDGHYSMQLTPGSYRVKFSLGYEEFETETAEFVTQFFDGATEANVATPVAIGSGATVTGIDGELDPAPGRLNTVSVVRGGEGTGAIVSSPAGIDCGASCVDSFETRKTVTLHAEPAAGSKFAGWTGACSGTGPCQIRLTAETTVAATFEPTATTTPAGPSTQTAPTIVKPPAKKGTPRPRVKCKKGLQLKKVGKAERCVKKSKPKKHPRKHRAQRH